MNQVTKQLYTVDDVASRLNVHAKTVRRYIQQGRLPAKRIGKEYRITRTALDEFAGAAPPDTDDIPRTRQTTASSIVDIDAISPEDSQRITTFVMASLNSRRGEGDFPRVDSVYDAERGRLRVMIAASLDLTSDLLRTIDKLTESRAL